MDQRFAVITDPFAPDMTLDAKHAGRIVPLLAEVVPDALECAVRLGFYSERFAGLKLSFNPGDIGIDRVIEQAGLLRIQLFTALGKLHALEPLDSWVSFSISLEAACQRAPALSACS